MEDAILKMTECRLFDCAKQIIHPCRIKIKLFTYYRMNKGPPKHVYGNKNKLIVRELNSNLVRDRTTNVFRQSAIDKKQDDSAVSIT